MGLEKDVSETDRYGRLLRYVWVGPVLFNEVLVRQGYANVSTYPPDVQYQWRFVEAERAAREEGAGLWSACAAPPPPPPSQEPPRTGCDPSYPDVCIPSPPPDLDCSDIPYRRFQVRPPDPHRFDGDGDGVGCES